MRYFECPRCQDVIPDKGFKYNVCFRCGGDLVMAKSREPNISRALITAEQMLSITKNGERFFDAGS